jgi:hypothetical protein
MAIVKVRLRQADPYREGDFAVELLAFPPSAWNEITALMQLIMLGGCS